MRIFSIGFLLALLIPSSFYAQDKDTAHVFQHDLGAAFRAFQNHGGQLVGTWGQPYATPSYRIWYGRWGAQVHVAPRNSWILYNESHLGYGTGKYLSGLDIYFRVVHRKKLSLLAMAGNTFAFLNRRPQGSVKMGSEHLLGIGVDVLLIDRVHLFIHSGSESDLGFEEVGFSIGGDLSYRF